MVLEEAKQRGCEVYAVGGSVRDLLLGRKLGDIDLAVVGDAVRLAKEIAARIDGGRVSFYRRFGTALIKTPQVNLEFATARRESYLPDSRKPAEVVPVPIEDDLCRRDFTVNALAICLAGERRGELIDLFDGLGDLDRHLIRTPLEPERTFSDDPLRMLRAVRFAAELGFDIHPRTRDGIHRHTARLAIVARERIGDEFHRMLKGRDPVRAVRLMIETGLMDMVIPEVTRLAGVEQRGRHHHKDILEHSLKVMQNVARQTTDPVVRLAALLHDVGKPDTKEFVPGEGWTFHGHEMVGARIAWRIGRNLRLGKEQLKRLVKLIRLHMRPINLTTDGVTDSAIRRMMVEAGDLIDDQLLICRADITTANPQKVAKYLADFDDMIKRMADVKARDRMQKFQSPIRGEEIMELCGVEPGPVVGALKGRIEDAILDGVIPNEYQAAKEFLLKIRDEVVSSDPQTLIEELRERSRFRRSITSDFKFPE